MKNYVMKGKGVKQMNNEKAKSILIVVLVLVVLLLTVAVVYNVTTGKSALEMFAADKQETEDGEGIVNQGNTVQGVENKKEDIFGA